MKLSRKGAAILAGCMFAMAAAYYAFIFVNRDRIIPENWDYFLQGGLMMIGAGLGAAINAIFYDRLEAWKARRRKKLKGSVLGTDITRWFRRKSDGR